MIPVTTYSPELDRLLPQTAALLKITRWQVHPGVLRVILAGSRGLNGHPRPDSDVDLSLIVDPALLPSAEPEREAFLRAVIETTLNSWHSPVEVDVAAPFGSPGALRMFSVRDYDAALVSACAPQIGLYKLQKGFSGYVPPHILEWRKVYPLLTIWERDPLLKGHVAPRRRSSTWVTLLMIALYWLLPRWIVPAVFPQLSPETLVLIGAAQWALFFVVLGVGLVLRLRPKPAPPLSEDQRWLEPGVILGADGEIEVVDT